MAGQTIVKRRSRSTAQMTPATSQLGPTTGRIPAKRVSTSLPFVLRNMFHQLRTGGERSFSLRPYRPPLTPSLHNYYLSFSTYWTNSFLVEFSAWQEVGECSVQGSLVQTFVLHNMFYERLQPDISRYIAIICFLAMIMINIQIWQTRNITGQTPSSFS